MKTKTIRLLVVLLAFYAVISSVEAKAGTTETNDMFSSFIEMMDDVIEKEEGVTTSTRTVCYAERVATWTVYYDSETTGVDYIYIRIDTDRDEVFVKFVNADGSGQFMHYTISEATRKLEES